MLPAFSVLASCLAENECVDHFLLRQIERCRDLLWSYVSGVMGLN
jgi:hypothetical protein